MKKIFIVLAFIFVGMANAMQLPLLDGNKVRQYVHTDPKEIAYLKGIQNIQQENVQSCTQEKIQAEERTSGPGIEQIFSFLKSVQNHDVPHIKPFESDSYLIEYQNDEKKEVSAPLILGFCSVENADEQQGRATVDRPKKGLEGMQFSFLLQPKEKSNSKKRTCEEAASSDEKKSGLSKESAVSNASKRAANKSSTSSEKMKICGMNGCSFSAVLRDTIRRHQETRHEQKQCPYPGCAFHYQSKADFSQHIDNAHPELCCTICGYETRKRSCLLQHFQSIKHRKNLAFINSGEGQIV